MSIRLRELLMRELPALRYEPIDKRIRGVLGGEVAVDSTRAVHTPPSSRAMAMASPTASAVALHASVISSV